MDDDHATGDERETLAVLLGGRRNRQTGAPERIHVESTRWKGRILTRLGTYLLARPAVAGDDGWTATVFAVTLGECDLDQAIAALCRQRDLVQAEGRATCPAAPGTRNPRPPRQRSARSS